MKLTLKLEHTESGITSEETIELAEDIVLKLNRDELWSHLFLLHERLSKSRIEFMNEKGTGKINKQ